jgi:two-component system cell cycle response regulator
MNTATAAKGPQDTHARTAQAAQLDVLIAEDDDLLLSHLEAVVSAAGFRVTTTANGAAACRHLEGRHFPIAILDRNLPGMDGLTLCRRIRTLPHERYTYTLLLTIQDSEDDVIAGLDAGADDYLSKRSSPAQLIARLRTAQRILGVEQAMRAALERRWQMAMTDGLTGAPNRRYFEHHVRRELGRLQRFGGHLSLLYVDLDHFKQVNDRLGHTVGDEVLIGFSDRIRTCLSRDCDWHARLGGEEFAVVLPGTDITGAVLVAERIRHTIEQAPVLTTQGRVAMTASLGVTSRHLEAGAAVVSMKALLHEADRCMYASKHGGRNLVTSIEDLRAPKAGYPPPDAASD